MRFALLSLLLPLVLTASAQSPYETYTGWEVSTDPVLPASEAHPQLWFGSDDLDAIRAKWEDPAYAEVRARVQADINRFRSRNAEATDPSDRAQMAKALAFAWIVDNDIVARVKGYQALLLAYENVPREATSDNFSGEFDEIYRATWLQNFCAAYDWLHGVLSPEDDAAIRAALAEETALLADNMVSGVRYAPRPHNHRSKPAYAVGTAALTLSGHPDAAEWLRLSLEQVNTTTRYQFSADGVYREGSHYWLYTLVNGLPFLWQYREAGVDLFPAYRPTFEWAVQTRTGRGWMPALEDGFPKPAPTHMVAAAYATAPTALHSTAPLGEILQWNWNTTDFFTSNYTGATNDVVWSVDEFLTMDLSIPATPPDASPTQRLESGQVAFRSDWAAGDPETRMLLFHGVASADNHDHPDLLSYALNAENTPLAVDPGYGPDGFSDDRREWYTSARAHNVVTVDGFPARDISTAQNEGPESSVCLYDAVFNIAEMWAPNNGVVGGATVRRGVAFLDDEWFAVYDHVDAANPASLQVHVHGRGAADRTDNRVTWTAPDDTFGEGGALHTAFFADGPLVFDEYDGWTSFYFDREEAQGWVAARRNAGGAAFLHTLVASPAGSSPPEVTDLTSGELVAAEVVAADGSAWTLVTQRENTLRTAAHVTTDGTFAALGLEGEAVTRWGAVRATSLSRDSDDVLLADAPVTVSADLRDRLRQTFAVGPVEDAATLTVRLRGLPNPQSVTLDGSAIAFDSPGQGLVRFSVPEAGGAVVVETDFTVTTEDEPTRSRLHLGASPNPSAGTVRLSLRLPVSDPVRLAVYDPLGRRVATLTDARLAAGVHEIEWGGQNVAPGVYVAVAETAAARVTTRIVRL